MNNTLVLASAVLEKSPTIFKKFDYLKLFCDIFFCLVNIYKLFFFNLVVG